MTDKLVIENKVKEIIGKEAKVSPEKLTEKTRLAEDLGMDSLDITETIMVLEEEYNINIDSDDELDSSKLTVKNIVNYIAKYSE